MNTAATDYDGKNKYIRITDIDETSHLYLENNTVSPLGKPDEKFLVNENDILFARTGASVGKSYKYSVLDGNLYFAGFLIRVNVNKANCNFIFNQTLSKKYEKWVNMVSMRSGQPGINAEEYKTMPISLTEIKEQEKISSFLLLLDEKIQKQQQLVKLLKKYKKGLVREIMNQNINCNLHNKILNIEWKSYRLDDVVEFLDGKRKPLESIERANMKGQYPYYGASGIIDYINDYLFDEELLLLGEDGANILTRSTPLCFIAKGKYWVNNHAHVMKPKINFDIYFLCEALENIDYTRYNTGTAQPKLNQEKCRSIVIKCPNYEIQIKIGSSLSIFNKLIMLSEEKLNKLLALKRGLLQQLFI